jgi:Cu(I)/Ag(I) efflux system membrane protein CusA/SilA
MAVSIYPASRLGSEFMPTLNEGTLFYMPASLPGMSITKAAELLQTQNKIIKSFPEVESVYGKAGRANTATDPAPTEMFETVINLKPESEWRAGMTTDKLIAETGQGAAVPRRRQLLDDADQGAHRHAVHRHPHADRHQGLRQGSGEMEKLAARSRPW